MRPTIATAALLTAALTALAAPASAQGVFGGADRYISLSGGYVGQSEYNYEIAAGQDIRVSSDVDAGFAVSGAYGQRYSPNVRGELAVSYRAQDIQGNVTGFSGLEEGELTAFTLDLIGYYDFPVAGPVRPYVGAGAGVAQFDLDDGVIDDGSSTLNLQAIAGASAVVGPRATVFAEARYQRLGTIKVETQAGPFSGEDDISIDNVALFAGVRFGF